MSAVFKMSYAAALTLLERDFIEAIYDDVQRPIPTPAWKENGQARVIDVLQDQIGGVSDASFMAALQVIVKAAKGMNVQAEAEQWIAIEAKRYAESHADDYTQE